MAEQNNNLRELVAEVAAAYFSNSHVPPSEIPNVVRQISESLAAVGGESDQPAPEAEAAPQEDRRVSAAQARKSITPDALISFEDGKPYKTLKRHLSTRGLTVEQYREKYGLPRDYPSVAPSYSAARSAMAKQIGLGAKGRGAGGRAARAGTVTSGGRKAAGKKAGGGVTGGNR